MTQTRYRYAIIGTGRPHGTEGATGFGMAHPHHKAFLSTERTDLVAIADINDDHAAAFRETHELTETRHYSDYHEMLATEKPDIVSVCLWPHLHAEATIAACEAGVRAIHCEKPMAIHWGDAKKMCDAAKANGTVLTFNHQRRYLEPFQKAKALLAEGVIGELCRMEASCGDMFDWGTHWLDMLQFFNSEADVAWVMGQIDLREERRVFGALVEQQGLCQIFWKNGVRGLLFAGYEANIGCAIRLIGSDGTMEILWDSKLQKWSKGDTDWQPVELSEGIHSYSAIDRAAADLIRALDEPGYVPLLTVDNAIKSTEIIFATFESSRRRGRVDFPLNVDDSALLALYAAGEIGPNREA